MTNWVLQAIEREAMARAQREMARTPMTFTYMGVSEKQMRWLIADYRARTGRGASDIDPAEVVVVSGSPA